MNASPQPATALEIGQAIGRRLKIETGPDGDPELRALMVQLAETRCETAADALACLSLAGLIIAQTSIIVASRTPEDARSPLSIACQLASRAIEALERSTGLTAAGFLGAGPTIN